MAVLINFKICDNSEDCSGIEACPTGAFYWDEKKKIISVNQDKCIVCCKCETACPVGAIRVAKTEAQFRKIKKEIENDKRKISDLFIDRYGAQPIQPAFLISPDKWIPQIIKSTKLAVVELFTGKTIECMLKSIPIKELLKDRDIKYRKLEDNKKEIAQKYKVKKLPCLLFFSKGKMVGKIEGYFTSKEKDKLVKKINKIIN